MMYVSLSIELRRAIACFAIIFSANSSPMGMNPSATTPLTMASQLTPEMRKRSFESRFFHRVVEGVSMSRSLLKRVERISLGVSSLLGCLLEPLLVSFRSRLALAERPRVSFRSWLAFLERVGQTSLLRRGSRRTPCGDPPGVLDKSLLGRGGRLQDGDAVCPRSLLGRGGRIRSGDDICDRFPGGDPLGLLVMGEAGWIRAPSDSGIEDICSAARSVCLSR